MGNVCSPQLESSWCYRDSGWRKAFLGLVLKPGLRDSIHIGIEKTRRIGFAHCLQSPSSTVIDNEVSFGSVNSSLKAVQSMWGWKASAMPLISPLRRLWNFRMWARNDCTHVTIHNSTDFL